MVLLLSMPCAVGCLTEPGAEEVGVALEECGTANALASNALASNALTSNALASNALASNALASNALASNALVTAALADPNARDVFKYIVSCALPAGQRVDVTVGGTAYSYYGGVGLAPGWGKSDGHCDATCAKWVSACVLSRVNYLGVSVPLSLRGSVSALSSSAYERAIYPIREATYYGDIFATPQIRYACLSPGATSDPRVCGPSLEDCIVTVIGACDAACDNVHADGSFPNCRTDVRDAANKFPAGVISYSRTVTVFLQ